MSLLLVALATTTSVLLHQYYYISSTTSVLLHQYYYISTTTLVLVAETSARFRIRRLSKRQKAIKYRFELYVIMLYEDKADEGEL
jgi:hypothetical protein